MDETALDGVRYIKLWHGGKNWRIGSVNPLWREDVALLGAEPDPELVSAIAGRGVWLEAEGHSAPLAVLCCGLGAIWPGMGRELYDNFPVARDAMDKIAALADWDLLALMDEPDLEKISQTRWQIPYLFLLEYAQWAQFQSLGLRPKIIAGHSLGELIALCLAGVYSPESAWYLLDTRAQHVSELEAKAGRESGMMSVYAEPAVIDEILNVWPGLFISNRNTARQYVLSGNRGALLDARKYLRKKRIPAMMLNVDLAFHNPAMRVLRDLSLRRLKALEMHPPAIPVLSDITTGCYPAEQDEICQMIADLDENTVRWNEGINLLWQRDGVRDFLELGPQEILCGLVKEIEPDALCFASAQKGRELESMRRASARLYALGHLSANAIQKEKAKRTHGAYAEAASLQAAGCIETQCIENQAVSPLPVQKQAVNWPDSPEETTLRELLANAAKLAPEKILPELDLRYDLALRSSSFPALLGEIEKKLGITADFESLLKVNTVRDLCHALFGQDKMANNLANAENQQLRNLQATSNKPKIGKSSIAHWMRYLENSDNGEYVPSPIQPMNHGLDIRPGDRLILCLLDQWMLPRLWTGLASLGLTLYIPEALGPNCLSLAKSGSKILPLKISLNPSPRELSDAIKAINEPLHGFFFGYSQDVAGFEEKKAQDERKYRENLWRDGIDACGSSLRYTCHLVHGHSRQILNQGSALHFYRPSFGETKLPSAFEQTVAGTCGQIPCKSIELLSSGAVTDDEDSGDLLALELLYGGMGSALWIKETFQDTIPALKPSVLKFPGFLDSRAMIYPDANTALAQYLGLLQAQCQFSRFADCALDTHGPGEFATDREYYPYLPISRTLLAMLLGANSLFPWLRVNAFSDAKFFNMLYLPPAVTRECRLEARTRPWLIHDQVMSRMCRIQLDARSISANGRRKDEYIPHSEAVALLTSKASPAPALWTPGCMINKACARIWEFPVDEFYQAMGFGAPWRLLQNLHKIIALDEHDDGNPGLAESSLSADAHLYYQAELAVPIDSIAPDNNWGYNQCLRMVEAIIQASTCALGYVAPATWAKDMPSSDIPASLASAQLAERLAGWRCAGAGFIRFGNMVLERGKNEPGEQQFLLELRRSWQDERMVRFDAQIITPAGQILLTLNHLEFNRLEKPH